MKPNLGIFKFTKCNSLERTTEQNRGKFKAVEAGKEIGSLFSYNAADSTCKMPKKIILYVFYYPKTINGILNYAVSKARFFVD